MSAVLIAVILTVLVWFQPQRLLYDTAVDEDPPSGGDPTRPPEATHPPADL